jgi:peptide/nickel transport system substrate-binding protein
MFRLIVRRIAVTLLFLSCFHTWAATPGATPAPLRIVGPWEIHSIDPSSNGVFFTRLQVAETLIDSDAGGALRAGLAERWKVSADHLTWRFALRQGALFHDGTPVTASNAARSLEIARAKPGVMGTAPISRITAQQEEVVVELTKPFAPLPAIFAHASTQVLAPASYAPDGSVKQVIGTGPYRVSQLAQPQSIRIRAFDRWSGKKPAIREVSYLAVGRSESRALMAESGQSDLTFGLDPISLGRLKQKQRIQILSVTLPRTIMLKLNAGHPSLQEANVRHALSLALDRQSMTAALLRDPEMAATQLFPPTMAEWHRADLPVLGYDPAKAARLLAAAGWKAASDGILVRDGKRFEVTLQTYPDRPELPPLATAVQDQLRKVGIAVQVKIGNSSEIPAAHRDGSLELALSARNFALVPDPLITLLDDFSEKGGDWGAMNWHSAVVGSALQRLAADPAESEARAHRAHLVAQLQEELPVIPVAWYRQSAAVNKGLVGVVLDPLERSYFLADMHWR